jgi:predicted Na+-dependent transporter
MSHLRSAQGRYPALLLSDAIPSTVFFDCFLPPIQVLSVVLGPVFAGITINRYFPGISKMTKKITPLLSVFLVSLICGSVIGTSAGDVKAAGLSVVAAVVAVHMG